MQLWPIRSALFIDYENVAHRTLPETIPNWVAWLERGQFDAAKAGPRTFLAKRIYWNSAAQHLSDKFQQYGFQPVLCEKFAGLKNGADIRMAMDIVEFTRDMPKIKEFILVTKDSDFVPVLQMLRQKKRRTAVLVDPNYPTIFTTYRTHADIVIPMRDFMQATGYAKPLRGRLLRRAAGWAVRHAGRAIVWPADQSRKVVRKIVTQRAAVHAAAEEAAEAARRAAQEADAMELAVNYTVRVTSLRPNQATARKEIERELNKIPGFSKTGSRSYFGTGSYRALMEQVEKRTDRIRITYPGGGGISVWYVPKDEEKRRLHIKRQRLQRIRKRPA